MIDHINSGREQEQGAWLEGCGHFREKLLLRRDLVHDRERQSEVCGQVSHP